jgi:hypothetical protein
MTSERKTRAMPNPHPRLGPGEEDFLYDLQSVLGSKSHIHMDAARPIDRLFRYERVLQTRIGWKPFDFTGKCVVELGSGPLLGWGPMAVYLGASSYVCVEPRFKPEVLDSKTVWARFFLPMHRQLEALFDRDLPFVEFVKQIRSRIQIETSPIEQGKLPHRVADIVLSNNVLQHILPLEQALEKIQAVSKPRCRQFHNVNFTDHISPPDEPFRDLYRRSAEEYFSQDSLLNLKRPSDILAMFESAGLHVQLVPYYFDTEFDSRQIAAYWRRYDRDDLSMQWGFFVS